MIKELKITNYKLSPSTINLMLECKRCFWLQIVKGIKRPQGPFPSLPSGMDLILKKHFDRFMEKDKLPPEIRETCKDCKLFNDKKLLEIWRNNRKGIGFIDKNTGILLHGAVDNILISKNGKLVVLDYKTRGFPVKEDTHEYYQLQMDLYNFLLRKNNYETEDFTYLLFYYPKEVLETGEVIFDTELVKMKINVKEGEKAFNDAVALINGDIPEEKCEWCENK
ncbi:PD-(D/E)XK nuclease family protein [Candidatus Woesearchaeota archaeon]|nr:PD-(D/E)XK nuclease family protein [Candidatus Woesearchaeota archaeon]